MMNEEPIEIRNFRVIDHTCGSFKCHGGRSTLVNSIEVQAPAAALKTHDEF